MRLLLGAFVLFFHTSLWAESFFVPDKENYKDFLIEPWKPNLASIIAFKDPNCGYCIKALKNLKQYEDYNVFMFWSPILGKASDNKVNDIFDCDDPIGKGVINSVINRKPIICESTSLLKKKREQLESLNHDVVSSYNPQSVPAFYFGGQKINLNSLAKFKRDITSSPALVKLQWQRYEIIKVSSSQHSGIANAIIFIPNNFKRVDYLSNLLEEDPKYNWHLAENSCESKYCVLTDKEKLTEELKLLLNITELDKPVFVVNGMIVKSERYGLYQLEKLAKAIKMTSS
ncbi:MAG: thioredoxin fold domain-containing protein [Colwellia sp.]|nr:thioredoxin fold domain-containing protein [Colwellia sp.]